MSVWGWLKGAGLGVFVVVVSGLVALAFAAMAVFGVGVFKRSTANFRGETAATEQIQASGAFRIAAYDRFFDLCSSVQALEDQAVIYEDDPTALAAVRARRASLIREYNGDAAAEGTAGQFRDSGLPYQLDVEVARTTCAA